MNCKARLLSYCPSYLQNEGRQCVATTECHTKHTRVSVLDVQHVVYTPPVHVACPSFIKPGMHAVVHTHTHTHTHTRARARTHRHPRCPYFRIATRIRHSMNSGRVNVRSPLFLNPRRFDTLPVLESELASPPLPPLPPLPPEEGSSLPLLYPAAAVGRPAVPSSMSTSLKTLRAGGEFRRRTRRGRRGRRRGRKRRRRRRRRRRKRDVAWCVVSSELGKRARRIGSLVQICLRPLIEYIHSFTHFTQLHPLHSDHTFLSVFTVTRSSKILTFSQKLCSSWKDMLESFASWSPNTLPRPL